MDTRITDLARHQHGVVGRRQLLAAGLKPKHVDALVRRGHLGRVSRGTYLVSGAPLTRPAEAVAAAYRCGPDARVIGEPLLAMTGVHTARRDGDIAVLLAPGRTVTGVDWHTRPNPCPVDDHAATIDQVRSLGPARLLLEQAVTASDRDLARLTDGLRWAGRLDAVVRLTEQLPDHPGTVRLVASGLIAPGAPESCSEREVASVLEGLGFETQVRITPTARVDFFQRDAGLVLEFDGPLHEAPGRAARDQERDAALRSMGLAVERLDDEDLADPEALRARIAGMIAVLTGRPHPFRRPPGSP